MEKIIRAGGIPAIFDNGEWKYLFMRPSNPFYGGDQFQIAKGRVEDDDADTLQTAIRECGEELGLIPSNILKFVYLGVFFGRTHIYLIHVKDKNNFSQPTDETGEVKWLTSKEFMQCGRELHKHVITTLDELCNVKFEV